MSLINDIIKARCDAFKQYAVPPKFALHLGPSQQRALYEWLATEPICSRYSPCFSDPELLFMARTTFMGMALCKMDHDGIEIIPEQ